MKKKKNKTVEISDNTPYIWMLGGAALGKGNISASHPLHSTVAGDEKEGCFSTCE